MIKINKSSPPQILTDHKSEWTAALTEAIAKHGGYSKIPSKEKDTLLLHYRHRDIQEALAKSSHDKCAFCECKPGESGNIEVEHFAPKSHYPALTFEWDNLLPVCRRCNQAKSDFDTVKEPIIDPSKIDPETIMTYDYLRIVPVSETGYEETVNTTIEVCDLNCTRLYTARAELMKSLTEYTDELNEKISSIEEADTGLKRTRRITNLRNSLDKINLLLDSSSTYAGFCRWFVSQSPEYIKAKELIS